MAHGFVVGVTLSLALRRSVCVAAGLVLDARRGWRREICPPHR